MMPEQTMPAGTDPNSVRKVVGVQAPPEVAWRVFTQKMGTWWPLATYKIGKADAVEAGVIAWGLSSIVMLVTNLTTRTTQTAA